MGCFCQECKPNLLETESSANGEFIINATIKRKWGEALDVSRGDSSAAFDDNLGDPVPQAGDGEAYGERLYRYLEIAAGNGKSPVDVLFQLAMIGAYEITPGMRWDRCRSKILEQPIKTVES